MQSIGKAGSLENDDFQIGTFLFSRYIFRFQLFIFPHGSITTILSEPDFLSNPTPCVSEIPHQLRDIWYIYANKNLCKSRDFWTINNYLRVSTFQLSTHLNIFVKFTSSPQVGTGSKNWQKKCLKPPPYRISPSSPLASTKKGAEAGPLAEGPRSSLCSAVGHIHTDLHTWKGGISVTET